MIRSKWLTLTALLVGALVVVAPGAQAADPAVQALEDHLKIVRGDIMEQRKSALTTLIQLDASQAKVFWPLKEQYDAELQKIGDARRALLGEYAKVYKNLTPESARDFALRSLKLDEERNNLRRKYFELMSEKVSPIAAAQFLQLERQFETMMDLKVQTVVPLAGI